MALEVDFYPYVYRVLKQVYPETGLTGNSLSAMNSMVKINVQKIMVGVNQLMLRTDKKTISTREIQCACKLVLPGELSKHAISEGVKAVTKYQTSKLERKKNKKSDTKLRPVSKSFMAGLQFPVKRMQDLMMGLSTSNRKTETSAVYLAAVCEYLCAEVLELAGNAARDNRRARIIPRHIVLAVRNDSELDKLYRDTIFSGGVLPHLDFRLLPNKTRKG